MSRRCKELLSLARPLPSPQVPWIDPAEDADTVSESDVYQRISTHQFGGARAAGLSESLNTLVNALLHPSPARRLGCTEAGPAALTSHDWFGTLDLEVRARATGGAETDRNAQRR